MVAAIVGYPKRSGVRAAQGGEWIYIHNTGELWRPLGAKCFRAQSKRAAEYVYSNAGNSLLPRRTFVS